LLINRSGDLLDPQSWIKYGPIFDRHGKDLWTGQRGVRAVAGRDRNMERVPRSDQLNCPNWAADRSACRNSPGATMDCRCWGYPLDPFVASSMPSGDIGSPTGWGDSLSGTARLWTMDYNSSSSAEITGIAWEGGFAQTFRGAVDMQAWRRVS